MILWLLIVGARALVPTPECDVPVVEGHLYLTSVGQRNVENTCEFVIEPPMTFIEIERYGGRAADNGAWMNFTFFGDPQVTVSVGMNQIWVGDNHIAVPTTTKLEYSMWFEVTSVDDTLLIRFAPPASSYFGHVVEKAHRPSGNRVRVVANTASGMEQVIQNIQTGAPQIDPSVKRKSILALEKRILDIERELGQIHDKDARHEKLHNRHFQLHNSQHDNIYANVIDIEPLIDPVKQTVTVWATATVFIILVGVFVSWRTYRRHKKQHRWTL